MHFDTIIVGGGPAGQSAALVLARCRRRVLLIDAGQPRNYASKSLHNYLTRDGVPPQELLELGRQELDRYGVAFRKGTVTSAACVDMGFDVEVDGEPCATSSTLLLATGVTDELPPISNFRELYGRGVHHCPYCDGWHYRDQCIGAYGKGSAALGLALNLLTWSKLITVLTDGEELKPKDRRKAEKFGLAVRTEKVVRLEADADPAADQKAVLTGITFESGPPLSINALFFNTDQTQRSGLPFRLGCKIDEQGGVVHDRRQRTGVPGLFLAGDASRDVQFAIVAAAEGAKAAVAINAELQKRDQKKFARKSRGKA